MAPSTALSRAVLVRDTSNRVGAVLTIPAAAWRTLLATVRG
jgi:hypothetical protein